MSTASDAKLYNQLTSKVGKETAENLTTFIENKIEQVVETKLQSVESKIDKLAARLDHLASTMEASMATKADLAETKSEMMKWMFIFWVGQVAVTFGFIMLYIKK